MIATSAMAVTCAATFSTAMRRFPSGVAATNSRLPRRASPASVPDSAKSDHNAVISPNEPPDFHAIEPPRDVMLMGNGLP